MVDGSDEADPGRLERIARGEADGHQENSSGVRSSWRSRDLCPEVRWVGGIGCIGGDAGRRVVLQTGQLARETGTHWRGERTTAGGIGTHGGV